jgi:uncharacterized membrane protein YkvI
MRVCLFVNICNYDTFVYDYESVKLNNIIIPVYIITIVTTIIINWTSSRNVIELSLGAAPGWWAVPLYE